MIGKKIFRFESLRFVMNIITKFVVLFPLFKNNLVMVFSFFFILVAKQDLIRRKSFKVSLIRLLPT